MYCLCIFNLLFDFKLDKETLCNRLSQALNKLEYIEGENVYTSHQNQIL